jgi:signal transduction histidine kinase
MAVKSASRYGCRNAEDAIAANGSEKRIAIRLHPNHSHRKVQIDIEDNGTGVATRLYDRIFEPFFSTKDKKARSGLGLAVASRIIQEHGGEIFFETTEGKGAIFTIELPAVD